MTTAEESVTEAPVEPPGPGRWSVGRRRPGPAAPRVPAGRVAEPRHHNPAWLLGGILLVVMSALGGVLLFSARDDRVEVLVAARALSMGEIIERQDLRIERIAVDGALATVGPAEVDDLVGQYVVAGIPDGTLVNRSMFASGSALGPDEMEVGAALDPGEFPQSELPIGATVDLLVTNVSEPGSAVTTGPTPDPVGADASDERAAESIGTGIVTRSEERASGQVLVTVRVTTDVGLLVTQAATEDRLRIAILRGDG